MRSEDRKPTKRVFPLLQNLDLDSVTFDQIQGVGDPITIEDMNEQELQDLVLVNLARLAVSGEWTGLLEAGGGGGEFNAVLLEPNPTYDYALLAQSPPWGAMQTAVAWSISFDYSTFFPFVSPVGGELTEVGLSVNSGVANNIEVGFYDIGTDGLPGDKLGSCTIDVSSAGFITQSSFAGGAPTLVKGTAYWYAVVRTSGANTPILDSIDEEDCPGLGISTGGTGNYSAVVDSVATSNQLPSSFTFSSGKGKPRPKIGLQV